MANRKTKISVQSFLSNTFPKANIFMSMKLNDNWYYKAAVCNEEDIIVTMKALTRGAEAKLKELNGK